MPRPSRLILAGLCAAFLAAAIWMAWVPHSLAVMHGDDYAWYQSLFLMHDAMTGAAARGMIVSNTYYGWPFWLLSLAISFPFFGNGWDNDAGVLVAARLVACSFAAANLALVVIAVRAGQRRRGLAKEAPLGWVWVVPAMLLLMPLWWKMAVRIHPQHMLFFFETLALLLLIRDDGRLSRWYWAAIAAAGAALSIKIEALMIAPLFLAYLGAAVWCGRASAGRSLRSALLAVPLALGTFLVLNPYLLTSGGRQAWAISNFSNLADLRHGTSEAENILAAVSHLSENYYPFALIMLLLGVLCADAVGTLRRKQFSVTQWLAPYIGIALVFCVFFVSKNEPYYWLAPMAFLLFAIVPLLEWLRGRKIVFVFLCCMVLTAQAAWPGRLTAHMWADRAADLNYSFSRGRNMPLGQEQMVAREEAGAVGPLLQRAVRPVISPYTDFDFRAWHVRYVERIYGCLDGDVMKAQIGNRLKIPAVDLVVLRKNDAMLQDVSCSRSLRMIAAWKAARAPDFRLLQETPDLLVFGALDGKPPGGNFWNGLRKP